MRYTVGNTAGMGKCINVFVNGIKVDNVITADTDRGEVIYYPEPLRAHKNKDEAYTRKLRGHVTVEEIPNDH